MPNGRSHIRLQGHYRLIHRRKGKILHEFSGKNLVVDPGVNLMASFFAGDAPTEPTHAGLGSGTAAPDKTEVDLVSEHAGSRTILLTAVATLNSVVYGVVITATGTWVVNEVGLYNNAVGATLVARFLSQQFTMVSTDTVTLTWTFTFVGEDTA